jgi:hypothetical protein
VVSTIKKGKTGISPHPPPPHPPTPAVETWMLTKVALATPLGRMNMSLSTHGWLEESLMWFITRSLWPFVELRMGWKEKDRKRQAPDGVKKQLRQQQQSPVENNFLAPQAPPSFPLLVAKLIEQLPWCVEHLLCAELVLGPGDIKMKISVVLII